MTGIFLEGVSDNSPKSAIIIAESQVLCSVKPETDGPLIVYPILVLLAMFYLFVVKYPQSHINMLTFFEKLLLKKRLERPARFSYEHFIPSLNKNNV